MTDEAMYMAFGSLSSLNGDEENEGEEIGKEEEDGA
jgi:hypothetical protein